MPTESQLDILLESDVEFKNMKSFKKENMNELLKPRYLVIADYPGCPFKVNDVLEYVKVPRQSGWYIIGDKKFDSYENAVEEYPHLFRPLQWWELRSVEEMPEYLKFHDNEVIKVYNWNMETLCCDREDGGGCNLKLWAKGYGYLPATETEYQAYLNQLNK